MARERTESVILAELRDVERYLADVPPHSGSTGREDLTARRERLQRELDALRREQDPA